MANIQGHRWIALIFTTIICLVFAVFPLPAQSQSTDEEKSSFVTYVEEQISSENFKISLNGLEGTLSSDVSLSSITIADKKGVWLTITKPKLIWSRSSLLAGKVDVDSLTAEHIDLTRLPESDDSLPSPESKPFQLPDLPVAIILKKLAIKKASFAKDVFGLQAEASVNGNLVLDDGNLDADLVVDRLDGVGGKLTTKANFVSASQQLKLFLKLSEPANGIAANLLNIQNKPPVSLAIVGEGPVGDLDVGLVFNVNARSILEGNLKLKDGTSGKNITANLEGPLSSILPEIHRPFFGERSLLNARALIDNDGNTEFKKLAISGGDLKLNAEGKLLPDGFLSALNFQLSLKSNSGNVVILPVSEGTTSLQSLELDLKYDGDESEKWKVELDAKDVSSSGNSINRMRIAASGNVKNINNPATRNGDFGFTGLIDGIVSPDPGMQDVLNSPLRLEGQGRWATGQPVEIQRLQASNDNLVANLAGRIKELVFDGDLLVNAKKLASFSKIANTPLAGSATLRTAGTVEALTGAFRLKLNGTARNIGADTNPLKDLLAGETILSGTVSRDETGLGFEALKLANNQFSATVDGTFGSKFANIQSTARLNGLNIISPLANGPVQLSAKISGNGAPFNVDTDLAMDSGELVSKKVRKLLARFTGTVNEQIVQGTLQGSGSLAGKSIVLSGNIEKNADDISANDIILEIARSKITGSGIRSSSGLMAANLKIDSSDISDIAALALQKASGSVRGTVDLFETDGMQSAKTKILAKGVRFQDYRLGSANVLATIVDLYDQPKIGATVSGRDILAAGLELRTLNAEVGTEGDKTTFKANAGLVPYRAKIQTNGSLIQSKGNTQLNLDTLQLDSRLTKIRLRSPAKISNSNGTTRFSDISLSVGSGSLLVSGSAGQRIDIDAQIRSLPLAIINAIRPNTGASGALSGLVKVTGDTSAPSVAFDVSTSGLSVRELKQAGIAALNGSASGRFTSNTVSLSSLTMRNAQNINIAANGTIPLSGSGLRLSADGSAPLSLARAALASRGATAQGTANFNVNATGSLASPNLSGLVSVNNATFSDPLSNLKLLNVDLLAGLKGKQISITKGRASLSSGGSISLSGQVGIDGNYPADLAIVLANARYTDGRTFNTTASGELSVTGALLRNPTLGGVINLAKTEVTLPDSVSASSKLLDVTHVNPGVSTRETLARLKKVTPKNRPNTKPSILNLNLAVDAPNRIFIRGRGVDAELGGNIRVSGPVSNITANGEFRLIRGRLAIIGRRFDLSEGSVTLSGSLDPRINLVATTRADGTDAFINIAGQASDPKVTFTSSPELPEDEVLALIIFGRSLTDLSPAQILRLASIASELTGGNSPGLVDGIRSGAGLDDLDVVQDDQGNTAVKAGKYIDDNIYVGVQAGKKSQATINLDITDDITARGTVDSEGQSGIGIFFEKDY